MSRIAVMGDIDSIYGFGALGFDTFPFTEQTEAAKKLRELADGDYSIIYMTEALAEKLRLIITGKNYVLQSYSFREFRAIPARELS